jgi:hypothetical protein
MPRSKKSTNSAKRNGSKVGRNVNGLFIGNELPVNQGFEFEDDSDIDLAEAYDHMEEPLSTTLNCFKPWDDESGSALRAPYTGGSRYTEWRKRVKQNELAATMVNSKPITSFFLPRINSGSNFIDALPPIIDPKDTETLVVMLQALWEAIHDFGATLSTTEKMQLMRYIAVKNYISVFLEQPQTTAAAASVMAAKATYQGRHLNSDQRRRADAIRSWAMEFKVQGGISSSRQGKHVKTVCGLANEDMKELCVDWLKKKKPMERDIYLLKAMIDEKLSSASAFEITNENENENENGENMVKTVSLRTIKNYLSKWGFSFRKNVKGVFYDGHERPDVVRYRKEWAARMIGKSKLMTMYEGDNMEVEIPPTLRPGHRRFVMVTHDESIFYANDGKEKGWFLPGEVQLRGKGLGRSLMVSEFQCPCHGTMRHNGVISRKLFEVGANHEGYWTHEHVVKQLNDEVISIFKALHPDCMGLFLFDQSSNHKAYAEDALVASRMNRDPHVHPKSKKCFRKTIFVRDGRRVQQDFYEIKETGKRKKDGTMKTEKYFIGVKAILQQRGLWHDKDNSRGREGKKWRLFCGNNNTINNEGNIECCARHCLANQDDFFYQKCALQETLHKKGLLIDFYPKFHCECNWIERYWADLKRYTRNHCDYTYNGLKSTMENAFNEASPPNQSPTKIRRYYMKCWRYIAAYDEEMNGEEAEIDVCNKFKTSAYTSHRRLGISD